MRVDEGGCVACRKKDKTNFRRLQRGIKVVAECIAHPDDGESVPMRELVGLRIVYCLQVVVSVFDPFRKNLTYRSWNKLADGQYSISKAHTSDV